MITNNKLYIGLLIAIIIIAIFYYMKTNKKFDNDDNTEHFEHDDTYNNYSDEYDNNSDNGSNNDSVLSNGQDAYYVNKITGRVPNGDYKRSSYRDGQRDSRLNGDALNQFFVGGSEYQNNNFMPLEEQTKGRYSPFAQGRKYRTKQEIEDNKFNVNDFLPESVPKSQDWFDDVNDVNPQKIKNRHLINIYRPIGINTISSTLKNPSLDIRGAPPTPKLAVSPFLNSSIEPDHNLTGLC